MVKKIVRPDGRVVSAPTQTSAEIEAFWVEHREPSEAAKKAAAAAYSMRFDAVPVYELKGKRGRPNTMMPTIIADIWEPDDTPVEDLLRLL